MSTFQAKKLTLLRRLFYVYPKDFLLFLYFKVFHNNKHLRHLLFEKTLCDVAFVIRNYNKEKAPFELTQEINRQADESYWWKKDFYEQRPFHWRIVENYMGRLKAWIKELRPAAVLDIGCGNGARLQMLAEAFPQTQFIGVDFVLEKGLHEKSLPNVEFFEAYPLDYLRSLKLGAIDMVYWTQALHHALPKELELYLQEFDRLKIPAISLFETNANGYVQKNDGKIWSRHMGYRMAWCHNYSGYFKKYGYQVRAFHRERCDFHPSRSDFFLIDYLVTKQPQEQPEALLC